MWLVYGIAAAMAGLIIFATVYKLIEVQRASRWPSAPGRVVSSGQQARKVKVFSDVQRADGKPQYEIRNFANVVYEYDVGGRKVRNNRVSIGEDLGNFEVEETLARYPVGAPVTVYYNPRDPKEAVLERDPPRHLIGCVAAMVGVPLALLVLAHVGFLAVTDAVAAHLGSWDRAAQIMAFGAIAALLVLFALGVTLIGVRARRWPVVEGIIEEAHVDTFRGRIGTDAGGRAGPLAQSALNCTYVFNGVTYASDKLSMGGKVTASTEAFARREVARYRPGDVVKVYVNPDKPAEAVLDPRPRRLWMVWAVAAAMAGVAVYAALKP
jgi:hypothetical protein